MSDLYGAITDVHGIEVGHYTDLENATGCTVVICSQGAVGGVDVRGSSPGTRETDLLCPGNMIEKVHAVLLGGGSAYGLDAASGVMHYLEERGIGFRTRDAVVPIVPAAIIYDLGLVTSNVRPDQICGYHACEAALSHRVDEGTVGAGTGATIGKAMGMERAVKGGVGTASFTMNDGIVIGSLAVVNAVGGIVDPDTGCIVAGPRRDGNHGFYDSVAFMSQHSGKQPENQVVYPANTTLGVIATNATLSKEQTNKLAERGQDGMALAIRPCHTMTDGDVVFALSTGSKDSSVDHIQMTRLGSVAAHVMARAIIRAVSQATSLGGVPSIGDLEYE